MNNFAGFISPEDLKIKGDKRSLKYLQHLALSNKRCGNCDEHVWRYAGTGLCFSCTTGEADASENYEIGAYHS